MANVSLSTREVKGKQYVLLSAMHQRPLLRRACLFDGRFFHCTNRIAELLAEQIEYVMQFIEYDCKQQVWLVKNVVPEFVLAKLLEALNNLFRCAKAKQSDGFVFCNMEEEVAGDPQAKRTGALILSSLVVAQVCECLFDGFLDLSAQEVKPRDISVRSNCCSRSK